MEEHLKKELSQKNTSAYNTSIAKLKDHGLINTGQISDGYHTFDELYKHRNLLFINYCRVLHNQFLYEVVRKPVHEGFFALYLTDLSDGKQISYHLPEEYYHLCSFALDFPEKKWDGHTSNDVIKKLFDELS